jgi:hypothetical protein
MVRALKADVAAAKAESAAFEQKTRTATHEALQATSDATAKTQRAHKVHVIFCLNRSTRCAPPLEQYRRAAAGGQATFQEWDVFVTHSCGS